MTVNISLQNDSFQNVRILLSISKSHMKYNTEVQCSTNAVQNSYI